MMIGSEEPTSVQDLINYLNTIENKSLPIKGFINGEHMYLNMIGSDGNKILMTFVKDFKNNREE